MFGKISRFFDERIGDYMKYTSVEANKLLRKLNEEKSQLEAMERQSSTFNAALGEDIESVRPAYDYVKVQEKLIDLDSKIRTVKHAINLFNTNQVVPEFNMTIDQMLVYIPQLTIRKQKLQEMSMRLPKTRDNAIGFGRNSSIIDYRYTNYNPEQVKQDSQEVSDLLAKTQTALDVVNNLEKMEIDIEL